MGFFLPNFNLLGSAWRAATPPSSGLPPFVANKKVQLYTNPRDLYWGGYIASIRTGVDLSLSLFTLDVWEVPVGSGRYFRVGGELWMHRGFVNEYWALQAFACDATGALLSVYKLP